MSCNPTAEIKSLYILPHCLDSQSKCVVDNELGQFKLLFNVDKVYGDMPFELSIVYTSTSEDIKLSGFLEGKEMFMGKIPVFFTKGQNENKQTSEVLLANCSEDQMMWRLWVTAEVIGDQPGNQLDNQLGNNQKLTKRTFFVDFMVSRL
ncbi:MAG: hypothetical protein ACI9LM_003903 [Alteromonadaceae bacterium]|jgi:hypothetical protein